MKPIYFVLLIFCIILSCEKEEKQTEPVIYNNSGNISSDGGIVKTNDGASIEIPAGALSSDQTITITNITELDTSLKTGCQVYELKPDGLTFSDSITVTLPFNDNFIIDSIEDSNYGVQIMVNNGEEWEFLPTVVDLEHKVAKAKTNHFSIYSVVFPSQLTDYFYKQNVLTPYNLDNISKRV